MTALPRLGAAVPRRGASAFARWLGRSTLRLMGWSVTGEFPDLPKFVVAVAPHTSNWDFLVGVAFMFALDLRVAFLGKHTLFRGPVGALMRWIGGVPVDRTSPHGIVGESIRAFSELQHRVLAIAPQGTRTPVIRFKSGFLHIARGAGVPVVLVAFDYGAKAIRLGPCFMPGDDLEADLRRAEAHFSQVRGKHSQ
jgi:1-acyl-sn-glycerol-3-phosphate acyltransferase